MTKAELLAQARGKPSPFEAGGVSFLLLPLPWGELKAMQESHTEGDGGTAEAFTFAVVCGAVVDESGAKLLEPADCPAFPLATLKAVFEEVARRSGVGKGDDEGKA